MLWQGNSASHNAHCEARGTRPFEENAHHSSQRQATRRAARHARQHWRDEPRRLLASIDRTRYSPRARHRPVAVQRPHCLECTARRRGHPPGRGSCPAPSSQPEHGPRCATLGMKGGGGAQKPPEGTLKTLNSALYPRAPHSRAIKCEARKRPCTSTQANRGGGMCDFSVTSSANRPASRTAAALPAETKSPVVSNRLISEINRLISVYGSQAWQ